MRFRFRKRYLVMGPLILIIIALVIMQFMPSELSHNNPPVIAEPEWDSEATRQLMVRACYDCHSNETRWPWYSTIAPFSWMIEYDIAEGRKVLNFSEWTPEEAEKFVLEEAVELVSVGQMPLTYYVLIHPEANLSASEKGQLINGMIATFAKGNEALETENLEQDGE
jgi:hypothetical protein